MAYIADETVISILEAIRRELFKVSPSIRLTKPADSGGLSWSFYAYGPSSTASFTIEADDEHGKSKPTLYVLVDHAPHSHEPKNERVLTLGEDTKPVNFSDRAATDRQWQAFKDVVQPKAIARLVTTALRTASRHRSA